MSLKSELENSSVEEILKAFLEIEQQGKSGFRYDIGIGLLTDENTPCKIFPGPHPRAPGDYGYSIKILGYDINRRKEAVMHLCKERAMTVMEALKALKSLSLNTPIRYKISFEEYPKEGIDLIERWKNAGFFVIEEKEGPDSHIKTLRAALSPYA